MELGHRRLADVVREYYSIALGYHRIAVEYHRIAVRVRLPR
jgi:hypothetical protein